MSVDVSGMVLRQALRTSVKSSVLLVVLQKRMILEKAG